MSIQGEIDRINNNVSDALAATAEMGASVPETANSNDLGRLIRSIPQSGGGGTSINVTAEVGQTIVVKAVDENGKPTAWESADYQPRTHWMERVELLPETTVEIDPDDGAGYALVDFVLEAGKAYTIKYNGVEYPDCTGTKVDVGLAFGNMGALDESLPATEHPFVVMYVAQDMDGDDNIDHLVGVMPLDGSESVTLSILWGTIHKLEDKYLPDNVPHIESHGDVILPDYVMTVDEAGLTMILEPMGVVTIGHQYEVKIGNQTFQCTAEEGSFSPEAFYAQICDVNNRVLIHVARPEIASQIGAYGMIGNGFSEGETLSISAAYTAHKIDKRCLPPSFFIVPVTEEIVDSNFIYTVDVSFEEVYDRICRGDIPVLNCSSDTHSYRIYYMESCNSTDIDFSAQNFRIENGVVLHDGINWNRSRGLTEYNAT